MIRRCLEEDFEAIYLIVDDAAQVYKDVIPRDMWKDPYMSRDELRREINEGVVFWGYEEDGVLLGVMGMQDVEDVGLVRHAYVCPARQREGIGTRLLSHLRVQTTHPLLVGTWADAIWAIRFYQKHDFQLVTARTKDCLLRKYWSIPERQIETSVVLADRRWFDSPA